jgi:AraC-like DNA-binding protein
LKVVRSQFSTENMAGAEAFETWRSRGWPGFAAAFAITGDPYRFYSRQTIFSSGRATLFSVDIIGQGYRRTAQHIRRDGRDHVLFQLTTSGGISKADTGRSVFSAGPGTLAICDFSRETEHRSVDTRAVTLMVERDVIREAGLGDVDLHGVALTAHETNLLSDFMLGLKTRLTASPDIAAERFDVALPKVLSACLGRSRDAQIEVGPTLGALAIDRARRFIDATLTRPGLHVDEIIAVMHVSRATAYRLFEPFGGLHRFRLERRLEAARRDVLKGPATDSLGDIADRYGFNDHAHFTRAFRTHFGYPPSMLRV